MIEYNRYSWWRTVFSFRGTALPRALARVAIFTLYSATIQLLLNVGEYIGWFDEQSALTLDPIAHAVIGSLLGFLIVFRMNGSNNRYWEGRSHWGSLINCSRNLVRVATVHTKNGAEIAGLVTGYVIALKQSLRGSRDLEEAAMYLPNDVVETALRFGNPPTAIAAAISEWILREYRSGTIDGVMVTHMEELLSNMVNAQGGCEKIQKTPLPFVYAAMIKQLILAYLLTLPLVIATRCGWWSPLLMAVVSLGLFGMEEASVETEDPFGKDENCLDMQTFILTIARDSGQLAAQLKRVE